MFLFIFLKGQTPGPSNPEKMDPLVQSKLIQACPQATNQESTRPARTKRLSTGGHLHVWKQRLTKRIRMELQGGKQKKNTTPHMFQQKYMSPKIFCLEGDTYAVVKVSLRVAALCKTIAEIETTHTHTLVFLEVDGWAFSRWSCKTLQSTFKMFDPRTGARRMCHVPKCPY